jgi:enamine deaminase RidA (YjgF/YER057c/UK114 family)
VTGGSDGITHRLVNPESLPAPLGFSHAVIPASGTTVYLAGQAGQRADGSIAEGLVEQVDQACANVVAALAAVGARPEHLVSIQIFVTDADAYRSSLAPIGVAWRTHLGTRFPAVSLLEVSGLFDPRARVELVGIAVVPGGA